MVHNITSATEFSEIISSNERVLVDFSAQWCGPCKRIAPFFEVLSTKHENVHFCKVDVDEIDALSARYKITALPTFVYFVNGKESGRVSGASEAKITALLA